jgi:hypothetical protein
MAQREVNLKPHRWQQSRLKMVKLTGVRSTIRAN